MIIRGKLRRNGEGDIVACTNISNNAPKAQRYDMKTNSALSFAPDNSSILLAAWKTKRCFNPCCFHVLGGSMKLAVITLLFWLAEHSAIY